MTKTRSLKTKDVTEPTVTEEKAKDAPKEAQGQVDKVPAVAIAPELREALVNFLKTQPYAAVANLIQPLIQAQTVTLSIFKQA